MYPGSLGTQGADRTPSHAVRPPAPRAGREPAPVSSVRADYCVGHRVRRHSESSVCRLLPWLHEQKRTYFLNETKIDV